MEIKIGNKIISEKEKIFFIAEAGVNHNGSLDYGKKLIDIAVEAKADAIKFQTFKADKLNTLNAPKSTYHVETTGTDKEQSWFELLQSQEISLEMHKELISYCKKKEIIFLSTPYDEDSADMLDGLGIAAFKIASTDTNNLGFLEHVAKKKKPMILSSAMCNMSEVSEAIETVRSVGLEEIIMCQCTGNYPSKLSDSNLNVIQTYKSEFNCLVGYSDHTLEFINPVLAVGMGISLYEKHFTLDKNLPGPDHRMSLSPEELKKTISLLRAAETACGSKTKLVIEDEKENRLKLRKSIVANKDIKLGTIISKDMLAVKRPGTGIPPKNIKKIIGSKVLKEIKKETVIDFSMLELK